ncbi:hypothetical protein BG011_000557 [Mortierella polycephala]|uniref:Uncharacterized protein n=1 Tax=Mortierella polycephala TaxID=41804 RepID=A0A9P6TV98_9FUNG|nr:hypothetical protein BG011_000557 [Mortierella polycephala]
MKGPVRAAVKEATAQLINPQYFLETEPENYSATDYFVSCRGDTVQDDSTEKRLQNEWKYKVIPVLKESNVEFIRQTGERLDNAWKVEKRRLQEVANQAKDGIITKKYKTDMLHAFQEHRPKWKARPLLPRGRPYREHHRPRHFRRSHHGIQPSHRVMPLRPHRLVTRQQLRTCHAHKDLSRTQGPGSPETIANRACAYEIEAAIFFDDKEAPKDIIFGSLRKGERLSQWTSNQPGYDFVLRLGSLDLGDLITGLYNDVRKKTDLDHTMVDQIALLSGIVHIHNGHFGLSSTVAVALQNEVVDLFYSREASEADLGRARNAEELWSTWVRGREPRPIDTAPVMEEIMASFKKCKELDIIPMFYTAMNVFRKLKDRNGKLSETEWMTKVIIPFLEEFMAIQHDISFACANSVTLAGQERKENLNQSGRARQPDIIGKCTQPFELYYGELKSSNPRAEDSNTDRLRIAIFTKDSLDQLDRKLTSPPPVLSFQAVGGVVTIYLGAKVGNAIVHAKLSTITLPSQLNQLDLHEDVFYALFQVHTLINIANIKIQQKRDAPVEVQSFPTLGTPDRCLAGILLRIQMLANEKQKRNLLIPQHSEFMAAMA